MIGFIHITKTGGTDIKDKNKNKEIFYGHYHYEDGKFYEEKNMPCFAIIRNPIERFVSLFVYNTKGSNKYKKYVNIYDINDFISKMRVDKKFLNSFEGGMQFRKQSEWLNGNKNNTFVLKYTNDNCQIIKDFLYKEFQINYIYDNYNKINTSNYNSRTNINISNENLDFIHEFYKDDMILYEKLNRLNVNYIKFSEL